MAVAMLIRRKSFDLPRVVCVISWIVRSRDYNALMDGALIVDKPGGMTSHDVVARVRKIVGTRRVGHTGTLDPFATGVLVVLVGKATRLMQFLSGAEKEYEAVIRLGYATDTGDITGRPLPPQPKAPAAELLGKEDIEAAIASLRGEIEQVPPMYSAKKIQGRKLYELARRGEQIERQAVRVKIKTLEAVERDGAFMKVNDDATHDLTVRVVCSAGTYVRSLAEDLGRRLGVGAHLAELRRTRAGNFKMEDASTLERLTGLAKTDSFKDVIVSPDDMLAHFPAIHLSEDEVRGVLNGIELQCESKFENQQHVRLRGEAGGLIAVGVYNESKSTVHPKVVLSSS
jgi:tRNA pseudouridine55 synthase